MWMQYTESLILYFSCPCQVVRYFSKFKDIFMTAPTAPTAPAAQTAQKQKNPLHQKPHNAGLGI